jgi:hypothetical protein
MSSRSCTILKTASGCANFLHCSAISLSLSDLTPNQSAIIVEIPFGSGQKAPAPLSTTKATFPTSCKNGKVAPVRLLYAAQMCRDCRALLTDEDLWSQKKFHYLKTHNNIFCFPRFYSYIKSISKTSFTARDSTCMLSKHQKL